MTVAAQQILRGDGRGRANRSRASAAHQSVPRQEELDRAVRVPEHDPHFEIDPDAEEIFYASHLRLEEERAVNILLSGPPGTGKTTLPAQYAAREKRRCFIFDCGNVRQVSDWWGNRELVGNHTVFRPSALVYALSLGGVVVVLDEINRTPTAHLNSLMGLMDDRRESYVPAMGVHIQVGPGTLIVATANLNEQYAGTFSLDEAFGDRLATRILLHPLSEAAQHKILTSRTKCAAADAALLVRVASEINQTTKSRRLGIRHLLEAARYLYAGVSLPRVIHNTMLNHFSKDGVESGRVESSDYYCARETAKGVLGTRGTNL